ncbi:FAD-dependent monooxygenase [Amycolatopsis pigmentata]|uniref:FAD-dependent monooxygenase n=1 Tax=Amycolatopsis pigmentata TaxID=450801 RepID=A0ABW5FM75_9PSEU
MRVDRALVVGAGIGGLAAGIALARQGVDVEIVEVKPDARVLGVGINQPGNALRALDTLGVLDEVIAAGFTFGGNEFRDWKDTPIVYVPSGLGDDRVPPNVAISRAALGEILRKAAIRAGARVQYGVTVDELTESPWDVTVRLSDGRRTAYDLVAAFDGMRSPMRRRLFGTAYEPEFTGYSVWRMPLPRLRSLHGLVAFQGDRVKGGLIPLSDELMYLLLVTPEPGNPRHEPREFGRLLAERLAGFSGPLGWIRDRIEGPAGIVYSPLMQCRVPKPWHRGHVIVLGDAAHTAVPHLTQGAAMALEDAIVLADEIAVDRPLDASLTAVADLRFNRVRLVTDVSRAILDGEMAITARELPGAAADMRMELPSQVAFVENQLNAPYRSAHTRRARVRAVAKAGSGVTGH